MKIIDTFFFSFYRMLRFFNPGKEGIASVTASLVLGVITFAVLLKFMTLQSADKQYCLWIAGGSALAVTLLFLFLYGSEKEAKALKERMKHSSVLWPVLFFCLSVYGFLWSVNFLQSE